jgi:hypothetical protein
MALTPVWHLGLWFQTKSIVLHCQMGPQHLGAVELWLNQCCEVGCPIMKPYGTSRTQQRLTDPWGTVEDVVCRFLSHYLFLWPFYDDQVLGV